MRRALAWTLFALSVAWGGAILAAPFDIPFLSLPVYLAGGMLCHQDPARSFVLDGHQLPVCARCTGLHLAVPFGLLGLLLWRARRAEAAPDARAIAAASAPAASGTAPATTLSSPVTPFAVKPSTPTPAAGTPSAVACPAPPVDLSASPPDPIRWWRGTLMMAALPTALSVLLEWAGGPTSAVSRSLTAAPLGATTGALLAAAALGLDGGRHAARLLHLPSRIGPQPRESAAGPAGDDRGQR